MNSSERIKSITNNNMIISCLLVLLVSELGCAILSSSNDSSQNGSLSILSPRSGDDANTGSGKSSFNNSAKEDGANTTFYYEANAFLLNKAKETKDDAFEQLAHQKTHFNKSLLPPAPVAMTSGRSGRMLDLDALVGDMAASKANKANSISGHRQSRFLPNQPTLEVAGGKRLHIQGFIPIVGVKDVTEEGGGSGSETSDSDEQQMTSALKQQQQEQGQQRPQTGSSNDLPYAQSSIGHASFGVQRYLNSDSPSQQQQLMAAASGQTEAKFSGASAMVDTLKKPLKKLTGYVGGGGNGDTINYNNNNINQQNCLCVPFYMCKSGYISESSLGKSQIQQMIAQQQIEMKSGSLISGGQRQPEQPQQSQKELQYADSYVPVDERSFDKDIVTMASLTSFNSDNQTDQSGESAAASNQEQVPQTLTGLEQMMTNSSSEIIETGNNNDYSQEILGRMLGLKSTSKAPRGTGVTSAGGVCGLLRTCCNIPVQLFPSQQDLANERLLAQHAANMNKYHNQQQQQPQQALGSQINKQIVYPPTNTDLIQLQQQSSQQAMRYQQQQQQQSQKIPYGFPSTQISRMHQPLNSPPSQPDTSLIHRSNLFQQQLSNRYPPAVQPQVAQYTRAISPSNQQPLQLFQQAQSIGYQHSKVLPAPLGLNPMAQSSQQVQPLPQQQQLMRNPPPIGLGTRKILEGRCGLRQATGITGRVQNLQYHESSAEFGEYPAQAAILKRLSGSDSLFVCGGTLISQYWVATAAHCIKKHAQSDLKVRLGEWDVHRDDEFYPFVEKEVRDLVVHPEFVAGNLVNDIALLRLDSPVDPSLPHVSPSCLPNLDESFSRQRCWVTGWGKDSFGQKGSFQAVLREVELPVIGQAECESALRQTRLGPHYRLHSGFICAGGEGGRDACEGDGGSGLYCLQDGLIKVAGLVSWGIGCGQAGVPGVYVNMAHYRPWIENIISIDEDIYSPYQNMIGNNLISERSNSNSSSTNSGAAQTEVAGSAATTTTVPPQSQAAI